MVRIHQRGAAVPPRSGASPLPLALFFVISLTFDNYIPSLPTIHPWAALCEPSHTVYAKVSRLPLFFLRGWVPRLRPQVINQINTLIFWLAEDWKNDLKELGKIFSFCQMINENKYEVPYLCVSSVKYVFYNNSRGCPKLYQWVVEWMYCTSDFLSIRKSDFFFWLCVVQCNLVSHTNIFDTGKYPTEQKSGGLISLLYAAHVPWRAPISKVYQQTCLHHT